MAFLEKDVPFKPRIVDIMNGEQKARRYLEINPRAQIPSAKFGDKYVCGSRAIVERLDKSYGRVDQLFPPDAADVYDRVETVQLFPITFCVAFFHTAGNTDKLRAPFNDDGMRAAMAAGADGTADRLRQLASQNEDIEAGKVL